MYACVCTYQAELVYFNYGHAKHSALSKHLFCHKYYLVDILFYLPAIARSTNALSFCICNAVRKKNKAPSTSTNIVKNIAYCKLRNSTIVF